MDQIDEIGKTDKFRRVKEIEQQEGELISQANVERPINLEDKIVSVFFEKVKKSLEHHNEKLKKSYYAKEIKISEAWINLIREFIDEFGVTGIKVFKIFSSVS